MPGGLELLDTCPNYPEKRRKGGCCFVLKGLTPANRFLRTDSPTISQLSKQIERQGTLPSSLKQLEHSWAENLGLLALGLGLSTLPTSQVSVNLQATAIMPDTFSNQSLDQREALHSGKMTNPATVLQLQSAGQARTGVTSMVPTNRQAPSEASIYELTLLVQQPWQETEVP